jgi:hypothetical protein
MATAQHLDFPLNLKQPFLRRWQMNTAKQKLAG